MRAGADGAPGAIERGGRWLAVTEVLDRWRTEDRWWTGEPVSRAYYDVLLADGRVVTVFRDGIKGGWYEQRYG